MGSPLRAQRQDRNRDAGGDRAGHLLVGALALAAVLLCCGVMLAVGHVDASSGTVLSGGEDPVVTADRLRHAIAAEPERADLYLELATTEMVLGHNRAALRAMEQYERLRTDPRPASPARP